jgi:hypothetical protein
VSAGYCVFVVPVLPDDAPNVYDSLDSVPPTRRVEVLSDPDVLARAAGAINEFYRARGRKPAHLLIGWRTWLQLGWALGSGRCLVKPTELMGVALVVDDDFPDTLRALPGLDQLRFRL